MYSGRNESDIVATRILTFVQNKFQDDTQHVKPHNVPDFWCVLILAKDEAKKKIVGLLNFHYTVSNGIIQPLLIKFDVRLFYSND
uniref:Uncharacterized protein n=1 Tax=Romanomermis culicivorax TaxID=13658 RepID=A0A915JL87_ROMCU